MEERRGRGLGNHPWVVLVGLIASLIGIVSFVTGKQRLSDFFESRWGGARPQTPQAETMSTQPATQPEGASAHTEPAAFNDHGSGSVPSTSTESMVVTLDRERTKDIWTTSVYSYAPSGGGPGGGLDNERLRVGGWGDSYQSLIWFDLKGLPSKVSSARLRLFAVSHEGAAGATPIFVDRVTEPWDWKSRGTGSDHDRLWWQDRPSAEQFGANSLPPPSPNDWYSIDLTELYNAWQRGDLPNYGLQLRPARNDNQWATFVSSDEESRTSLRPQLVLEFEPGG